MNKTYLGVNIDHVATLRQARGSNYPEPVHAASTAELAGADSICVHLRGDRRHIQDRDVYLLNHTVQTRLNVSVAVNEEMVNMAAEINPAQVTLVHESADEITSEGGVDVAANQERTAEAVQMLAEKGIKVAIFIDPFKEQVDAAKAAGAEAVELYTGHYADGVDEEERLEEFEQIVEVADYAHSLGLTVSAGQGLNYHNVEAIASVESITELNIGHAIVCRAVFDGMDKAIRDIKALIQNAGR